DEHGLGGEALSDERGRRRRDPDLATVGNSADPRDAVERDADVVVIVPNLGLAGVDGHADAKLSSRWPVLLQQSALRGQPGRDRVRGAAERADHAVAFALLHRPDPALADDRLVQ